MNMFKKRVQMCADLGRFLAGFWLDGLHWHELSRLWPARPDHTHNKEDQKKSLHSTTGAAFGGDKQHKGRARFACAPLVLFCC